MIVIGYWAMISLETVGLINDVGDYWAMLLLETVGLINDVGDYWASDDCHRLLGHAIVRDCWAHK